MAEVDHVTVLRAQAAHHERLAMSSKPARATVPTLRAIAEANDAGADALVRLPEIEAQAVALCAAIEELTHCPHERGPDCSECEPVLEVVRQAFESAGRSRDLLRRLQCAERLASVAGDMWNLAHNVLGFLTEHRELLAETDAPVLEVQVEQEIERYDRAKAATDA